MANKPWFVYLLECCDKSYYCGATNDVAARVKVHQAGKGSKYVRSRLPCRLLMQSGPLTKSEALRSEALIKTFPRLQKLVVRQLGPDCKLK